MKDIIIVIHLLTAISLVALILLQQGRGADVGATFGAGSAKTMFGSRGSVSFLAKITALLIALFFITSLSLGYIFSHTKHYSIIIGAHNSHHSTQTKG